MSTSRALRLALMQSLTNPASITTSQDRAVQTRSLANCWNPSKTQQSVRHGRCQTIVTVLFNLGLPAGRAVRTERKQDSSSCHLGLGGRGIQLSVHGLSSAALNVRRIFHDI